MERNWNAYDTIAIMEQYNFNKPIKTSIIYEDNRTKYNQITNPAKNNLVRRNLQKIDPNLSQVEQQKNLCKRKGSMDNAHLNPYDRLHGSEAAIQKYNFNSNTHRNPHINGNPHINRININYNSSLKDTLLYKSQMKETILVNRVAENLASIMEAYVYFHNINNSSSCKQHIAQVKSQCLLRKLHCFQRCLICEELLLRHENDVHFIKNLMYKVVVIAKVTISHILLSNLYRDLLDWIKFKKNQRMNIYQQNQRAKEISPAVLPLSNSNTTQIFSYGPPGNQLTLSVDPKILAQQRNESFDYQESNATETNVHNSTITNSSNKQMTNTVRHDIPQSNYALMNESSKQNSQANISSIPLHSNPMYIADSELNHGIHNNHKNNYYNTMYPDVNHVGPRDVTRSSVSRDSGFTSPSVFPSDAMFNNIQSPSSTEVQDTSIFYTSNTTTTKKNIINETLPMWNGVQTYM